MSAGADGEAPEPAEVHPSTRAVMAEVFREAGFELLDMGRVNLRERYSRIEPLPAWLT